MVSGQVQRASEPVAAPPSLEVDMAADPEWSDAGNGAAMPEPAPADTMQPQVQPEYAPADAGMAAHGDQPTVTLTEVMTDDALFEDPDVEVARMTAHEGREIVIPVELGDGETAVKRYKLSITLRFDPQMLSRIKRIARARYLNYQSMMKQWLSERLEVEVANQSANAASASDDNAKGGGKGGG